MCNDYANHIPYSAYVEAFSQIRLPLILPTAAPNLEPRDDIWPTDTAPVIRRHEDGVELAQLHWGFPPGRPKAPPVINFRSEGRRFATGRCLVPADAFYEFMWTLPGVDSDTRCPCAWSVSEPIMVTDLN
ncbi:MAG: SOS response-associated peptidase [Pseudomonadota bacterium]|nr:SOS response-associated peptidase [Pseudomonadota bacterium]